MKRDMDLVRLILLEVEKHDDPLEGIEVQIEGYAPQLVAQHVRLLAQAGYLEAYDLTTFAGIKIQPKALTWTGHEFLSATRNNGLWQQLKAKLVSVSADAPMSVIQQLAIKIAATQLGLGS